MKEFHLFVFLFLGMFLRLGSSCAPVLFGKSSLVRVSMSFDSLVSLKCAVPHVNIKHFEITVSLCKTYMVFLLVMCRDTAELRPGCGTSFSLPRFS